MTDSLLSPVLVDIEREIPRIGRDTPPDAVYESVGRLLQGIFRLGLGIEAMGGQVPGILRDRLRADGDALGRCLPEILYFVTRWQGQFIGAWESDWRAACVVRSGLEFLRRLYADSAFGREFARLGPEEFEDIDAFLRRRAVHDGGVREEDIPPGVPSSHWWWRAPES